jgi:hypothetical protein
VQLYVAIFDDPVGPVGVHDVTPETPPMVHVGDPVGVMPPAEPVTVAVKITEPPSDTPLLPATATVTTGFVIVV